MPLPRKVEILFTDIGAHEPCTDVHGRVFTPDSVRIYWVRHPASRDTPLRFRGWELIGPAAEKGEDTTPRVSGGIRVPANERVPPWIREIADQVHAEKTTMFGLRLVK